MELSSRVGSTTLRAEVSERMVPGVVYTTFHHPVTGANVVTTENSDWATNCPEYKVTAVQVGVANARGRSDAEEAAAGTGRAAEAPAPEPRPGGAAVSGPATGTAPEARMGNDIARQFAHLPAEDAVARIAAHLGQFWDPRMRRTLQALAAAGDDTLDPRLAAAAQRLA